MGPTCLAWVGMRGAGADPTRTVAGALGRRGPQLELVGVRDTVHAPQRDIGHLHHPHQPRALRAEPDDTHNDNIRKNVNTKYLLHESLNVSFSPRLFFNFSKF